MIATYTLTTPVELGGATYTELELRVPLLGEMKKARAVDPLGNEAYVASLIQQIAKVPMAMVDKLTAEDFEGAAAFLSPQNSPKIGSTT